MLRPGDLLIDDSNWQAHMEATVDGEKKGKGAIPRPYDLHPVGSYRAAPPAQITLIPRNEWPDRIREKVANKSQLSDIRRNALDGKPIPSLDQNGKGYCWYHSVTMCNIMKRAQQGQPYVRLSAFMGACLIKNYKDEGGWAALALDFMEKNGTPSVEFWPEKSMSRSNDTPAMRENAKLHIVTGSWADLAAAQYDRNLSFDQSMTCLLSNDPNAEDFNWWGHSVCILDAVLMPAALRLHLMGATPDFASLDLHNEQDMQVMAEAFGKRGINSWTDSWGNLGEFVLSGKKMMSDGAVSLTSSMPSVT